MRRTGQWPSSVKIVGTVPRLKLFVNSGSNTASGEGGLLVQENGQRENHPPERTLVTFHLLKWEFLKTAPVKR